MNTGTDTIFFNGTIMTMDARRPRAQAVAVKEGVILCVGTNDDALALGGPKTRLVDLEGRLMLPGFNDSHMHLLSYGYSLEKANLAACRSVDDIIKAGRQFADDNPHLSWIQGRGWDEMRFDSPAWPTRHDLDKVSQDRPVAFSRVCSHVIAVNTRALEIMGVTQGTAQPPDGSFDLDDDGRPLGIFRRGAKALVTAAMPPLSAADLRRMMLNGGRHANRHGITSVQSDDFPLVPDAQRPMLIEAFAGLARGGGLPVRVHQQCRLPTLAHIADFAGQGYACGMGDDFFRLGPLKLICDGGLGARTALLSRPYADDGGTSGQAAYSQEELDALVLAAHRAGMPSALHCIGDKSLEMCIDAIAKAMLANPRANMRHSVIHCQASRPEQLARLAALGIGAHIQPIFIDYDRHIAAARLGGDLLKSSYNWRTIADLGVHYACGSDCPAEHLDVIQGIACAVTSQGRDGLPPQGWMPDQRLSVHQAVHGFTLGAAWMSGDEARKGSLAPGKLADMAVLSRDIFSALPEEIGHTRVDITVLGGKIVYQR